MLTSTLQWPHQLSFPAPAMVQGMVLCRGLPLPSSVCIGQIVSTSPHTDGSSLYALAHLSYTGHSRGTRISFVSEKRTKS